MSPQANNPLHGITLERMLTELVDRYGWESLGAAKIGRASCRERVSSPV